MTSSVDIFVRFTHTGFHHWSDAPPTRAYLAQRHRHVFHFEAQMSVLHNDREVEFHDLLDDCKMFVEMQKARWELDGASCEHMALALAEHLVEQYDRPARVEVSEDGENGSRVSSQRATRICWPRSTRSVAGSGRSESMRVTKRIEFDAGHRVARHGGQCANPHGHRYFVDLTVEGPIVDDDDAADYGMVVDFGRLKNFLTTQVHDRYDHGFIVEDSDDEMRDALRGHDWKVIVVPWTPTAENLAQAIGRDAGILRPMRVVAVTVFETPTSSATWTP